MPWGRCTGELHHRQARGSVLPEESRLGALERAMDEQGAAINRARGIVSTRLTSAPSILYWFNLWSSRSLRERLCPVNLSSNQGPQPPDAARACQPRQWTNLLYWLDTSPLHRMCRSSRLPGAFFQGDCAMRFHHLRDGAIAKEIGGELATMNGTFAANLLSMILKALDDQFSGSGCLAVSDRTKLEWVPKIR